MTPTSIGRFTIRHLTLGVIEGTCNWCGTVETSPWGPIIDDFRKRHVCPTDGDVEAYVLPEGKEWR